MDKVFMQQAIDLAYRAEKDGNLPVEGLKINVDYAQNVKFCLIPGVW